MSMMLKLMLEAILECRAALIEQDMTAKEIDEGSWEILEKK